MGLHIDCGWFTGEDACLAKISLGEVFMDGKSLVAITLLEIKIAKFCINISIS